MKKIVLLVSLFIFSFQFSKAQCPGTSSSLIAPDSVFACATLNDSDVIAANISNGNAGWDFTIYKCSVAGGNEISDTNFVKTPIAQCPYYFITADSGGCTLTHVIGNYLWPVPSVILSPDLSICKGSCGSLTATGTGPLPWSFSWSPTTCLDNPLIYNPISCCSTTTTYTVNFTNGHGCTNSDTTTITVNQIPLISAGNDTCINLGGVANLCATPGGGFYQWTPPTFLSCLNCQCPVATPSSTTSYVVTMINVYGCTNSDTVIVGIAPCQIGINEIKDYRGSYLYPNPLITSSALHLTTQLNDAEVIIYDMLGKEMMRKSFSGNEMKIGKGNLESGVYFVKVSTDERQWVQKIIVE